MLYNFFSFDNFNFINQCQEEPRNKESLESTELDTEDPLERSLRNTRSLNTPNTIASSVAKIRLRDKPLEYGNAKLV